MITKEQMVAATIRRLSSEVGGLMFLDVQGRLLRYAVVTITVREAAPVCETMVV